MCVCVCVHALNLVKKLAQGKKRNLFRVGLATLSPTLCSVLITHMGRQKMRLMVVT